MPVELRRLSVWVWCWLAGWRLAGRDDEAEVAVQPTSLKCRFDFRPGRAGRNPERPGRREARHTLRRAGVQHVAARIVGLQRFEYPAFLVDERAELLFVERPIPRLRDRLEDPRIVVAQVGRVVLLARQRQAERFEHFLIRAQVQRLGVDEHAVEVEDDRRDHLGPWPELVEGPWPELVERRPSSSPARTGIVRRFSRGGSGQS